MYAFDHEAYSVMLIRRRILHSTSHSDAHIAYSYAPLLISRFRTTFLVLKSEHFEPLFKILNLCYLTCANRTPSSLAPTSVLRAGLRQA
jgi:hypothetical protein